jgi:hypothetical protein
VIYCALEGTFGIQNRIAAFRTHHQLDGVDLPLAIEFYSVNLRDSEADVTALIDTIIAAATMLRAPVKWVIIDTLSRALAGGNESGSDDMGALIVNTDRIRSQTGAHVTYIHHTGKDQARGSRGWSGLRAAVDTEIEVSRADKNSPSVARVTKQRDLETEGEFSFRLRSITLGHNRRGAPVTSCVVVDTDNQPTTSTPSSRRAVSPAAKHFHRALLDAIAAFPSRPGSSTVAAWRAECVRLGLLDQPTGEIADWIGADGDIVNNIVCNHRTELP